jgi:hypothetical protein
MEKCKLLFGFGIGVVNAPVIPLAKSLLKFRGLTGAKAILKRPHTLVVANANPVAILQLDLAICVQSRQGRQATIDKRNTFLLLGKPKILDKVLECTAYRKFKV